jgi:putative ABC transport system permease protein
MVMKKKNVLVKNLLRTIGNSFGRYVAIMAIIALGAATFVGLLSTKGDMIATGQKYMDEQNMFDLRLISAYGWTQTELDKVLKMESIESAEGIVSMDVLGSVSNAGKEEVYKLYSIPEKLNKVYLLGGRMPENANECLIDGRGKTDAVLGSTFTVSGENEESTLDSLHIKSYTVVGYVNSPLYMDMSRGSTSLGNGTVSAFVYLPEAAFNVDYFTEIDITLTGDYDVYTDQYNAVLEKMAEKLKPGVTLLAGDRLTVVKAEAEEMYADGQKEYEENLKAYEDARDEALSALDEALHELEEAQKEVEDNEKLLADGLKQIEDGQKEIDRLRKEIQKGWEELNKTKTDTYKMLDDTYKELTTNKPIVEENLAKVNDGLKQLNDGLKQMEDGINQLEDGLSQIADGLTQLDLGITLGKMQEQTIERMLKQENDPKKIAQLEAELADIQEEIAGYEAQKQELLPMQSQYSEQLADLKARYEPLVAQRDELLATKKTLTDAQKQINDGFQEVEKGRKEADKEFASAEKKLKDGEKELEKAQQELNEKRQEAADGEKALADGKAELEKGWSDYRKAQLEVETELAEAKEKLDDAAAELAEAERKIAKMTEPEVFILDRNTNIGYLSLSSNADIVAGISRVFPAFFLLVAALVCITTMTRMVEEERTQIGTFKALGYSEAHVVGKYMLYAGSASVFGCGFGVLFGSVLFPVVLWKVYCILLNITPNVLLRLDIPLCLAVVLVYAAAMLAVTWYCCHKTLKEVPAQLIRPKAPTSGKKIFLEYLPFWKHFSFLNKVMLRNVFRYHQRLLMMLMGIGGCTALLLTGFGIRDSIVNTIPVQYNQVSVYDMEVYFSEGQTQEEQLAFKDALKEDAENVHFFYQSSVDIDFGGKASELSMIVSDASLSEYMHFTQDGQPLTMPGTGEVYLSIGTAEKMGIQVGDTVTLRDSDMQVLSVKVAGIYLNHVRNFVIVTPDTLESQWGYCPAYQIAYVNVPESVDVHETGAKVSELDEVINVSITQDVADRTSKMLDAMNLIVVVVIIFSGALAIIVMYNLTNINITERIREIATIKVLGFRAFESAAYVFKENLLLTGMGVFIGLFAGQWLLDFVMDQIQVNTVWFMPQLDTISYVLGVVITIVSSLLVDFLLYFKLEKINMAEALKSVE